MMKRHRRLKFSAPMLHIRNYENARAWADGYRWAGIPFRSWMWPKPGQRPGIMSSWLECGMCRGKKKPMEEKKDALP